MSKEDRNVFLYWIGNEYKLIKILRDLINLHSHSGIGYKVNLITDKNLNDYIKDIPEYFNKLCPAHQADFVRVNVICDYGGIWIDSDTIIIHKLDSLFELTEEQNGFFITQNKQTLWNGIFGSKKNTSIMLEWKKRMITLLDRKKQNIQWEEIGNNMLQSIKRATPDFFNDYKIFNGLENLYPINWNICENEFIKKPYNNYKNIIREYQPLVVLVNSVYKAIEKKTYNEILNGNMPINYFINKSIENIITNNIEIKKDYYPELIDFIQSKKWVFYNTK
jgi:mannosyltransferase OCH1-like enzyme